MDGMQKTVNLGLTYLATKVAEGAYGEGDEAFQDDSQVNAFLEDFEDEVISKMDQKMKCPKCKAVRLQEAALASCPPRYEYWCCACGWGLRYFQRANSFVKLTEQERKSANEKNN